MPPRMSINRGRPSRFRALLRRKTLPVQCKFLTLIAAAAALNKKRLLTSLIESARNRHIPPRKIAECLLQCYLFAGYPATIEGFIVFRRVFSDFTPKKRGTPDSRRLRVLGERVCRTIYKGQFETLLDNVRKLHPDLAEWMLLEGYGKVLGRRGLPLNVRELITVSLLASTGWERQLFSHIRGAIHAGASREEVQGSIEQLRSIIPKKRLQRARAVYKRAVSMGRVGS